VNFTVKAAARATGVSESRLRTWERRYGIPRPGRSQTGRRLYNDEDLVVIRRMAALVEAGMSAAEAAEAASMALEPPSLLEPVAEHELVAAIATAAERYDEPALLEALRRAVDELGWGGALSEVIFPGLRRVGLYWETALFPPANEHFASELVRREIHAAISALDPLPATARCLLLACPEDERHDLGLAALSLLLRRAGVRTIYLGADVPTPDLIEAYDRVRPVAICLSATSAIGLASLIRASRALVSERHARVFFGGPAASASGAEAAGIMLPPSVQEAADVLVRAVQS
jgi:DNA-binding transcriptional MerR regulator